MKTTIVSLAAAFASLSCAAAEPAAIPDRDAAAAAAGSRRMQLKQSFAWKDGAWTPDGLANQS